MGDVNSCCAIGAVFHFLRSNKESWLHELWKKYRALTHTPRPDEDLLASWSMGYDILRETFTSLGDAFHNLFLIFEYGLPLYPPREDGFVYEYHALFADCVILSREHVIVLEFQNGGDVTLDTAYAQTVSVSRLRWRVRMYHDQSRGMNVHGILVSSARTGFLCHPALGVAYCSADKLGEELIRILGPKPIITHYRRLAQWTQSSYSNPVRGKAAREDEYKIEQFEEEIRRLLEER